MIKSFFIGYSLSIIHCQLSVKRMSCSLFLSSFVNKLMYMHVCMCGGTCVCAGMHIHVHVYSLVCMWHQRMSCGSKFSPSTIQVLENKVKPLSLAVRQASLYAEPSCWSEIFKIQTSLVKAGSSAVKFSHFMCDPQVQSRVLSIKCK